MSKRIDLTGKKFGRLTVIKYVGTRENHWAWECICDCGNANNIPGEVLRNGASTSCGCYKSERIVEKQTKHNMCKSSTYKSWASMKNRCLNKNSKDYGNYGGRGIVIYDKWVESFDIFLKDMGERPKGTSLDRINNSGNYEPSNCRWATRAEQHNNTRKNVYFRYNGETKTISEWAKTVNINISTLYYRLCTQKWTIERSLQEPPKSIHYHRSNSLRTQTSFPKPCK